MIEKESKKTDEKGRVRADIYRVSHSKEGKVILLWWGYRFWFLLIFWVLCVHEKGTFMLNSSVFIFLMLRALYRMICKSSKKNFAKKSLNVTNVKLLSNFFFNVFGFFMPFWWEWQLALYILSNLPGIKKLNGLNDLNNLSDLNDLYSLISLKNLWFSEKCIFLMVCYFLLLEKGP